MNSIPARMSAASTALSVLRRGSTEPRSRRANALREMMALSANCCCDQFNKARAARICLAVTMAASFGRKSISATYRVKIHLIMFF